MTAEDDESVYEAQHRIWPDWAASEGDAGDAVPFLMEMLDLRGGRVLDLGCGSGRMLCAFAERGFDGVGVDLSSLLLDRAGQRAKAAGVGERLQFVEGDYESVEVSGLFDLVLLWDSTMNFLPEAGATGLLRRWRTRVAIGGFMVVEQLSRAHFAAAGDHHVRWEGPAGSTDWTYSFDHSAGVLEDRVVHQRPGGEPETLPVQRLHLYAVDRLAAMMGDAGFPGTRVVGSQDWTWKMPAVEPVTDASHRVLAFGRRLEG